MKTHADDLTTLNEIREIIDRNLFPIFSGMLSEHFFSQWTPSHNTARDYLRLKELLGIDRGCSSTTIDNLEKYQTTHPSQYDHMMRELQAQIAIHVLRQRFTLPQATFMGTGLVLNASPFSRPASDANVEKFVRCIESGQISFE